jgi:hypothetical protein
MPFDYELMYRLYLTGHRPVKIGGRWWAWLRLVNGLDEVQHYMLNETVEGALFCRYGVQK